MIGFVTTTPAAEQILALLKKQQADAGFPHFWTLGAFPIIAGEHAGKVFIPASDELLATHLFGNATSKKTPMSAGGISGRVTALGGKSARVDLPASVIQTAPQDTSQPIKK